MVCIYGTHTTHGAYIWDPEIPYVPCENVFILYEITNYIWDLEIPYVPGENVLFPYEITNVLFPIETVNVLFPYETANVLGSCRIRKEKHIDSGKPYLWLKTVWVPTG